MKRFYPVIFLFLFLSIYCSKAELAFNIGGSGLDHSKDIAVDSKGNIISVGYFSGAVDFDPSDADNIKTAASSTTDPEAVDIYVAKYDSSGNLKWVFTIGSPGDDMPNSVYIDELDYIYITGSFSSQADFDPSQGGTEMLNAGSGRNAFIAKYDQNGRLEWANGMGDEEAAPVTEDDLRFDEGFDVAVDYDGNVYVTGTYNGKIDLDMDDGEDTEDTFTSANGPNNQPSRDIFLAAYDTTGAYKWGFGLGGPGRDEGHAVRVGEELLVNIYIAGMFSNTVNFQPNSGTLNLASAGGTDAFLAKVNNFLDVEWAIRWGSSDGDDQVSPGAMETFFSYLYVGGIFTGSADFDPSQATEILQSNGMGDAYVATFTTDGDLDWAKGFGGSGSDAVNNISVDIFGDIYATGWFTGTADFDPAQNKEHILNANSSEQSSDIFLTKLTAIGSFEWAHNFGSAETDPTKSQTGSGIALDPDDNPIITGRFTGLANFATNGDTYELVSEGNTDGFIAKYDYEGYLWSDDNQENIQVTAPNGGEELIYGSFYNITWTSNITGNVKIVYTTDGGINWINVADFVPGNVGYYNWMIPNTFTTQAKVKIFKVDNDNVSDESDNPFSIVEGNPERSVTLVYPNGGETFNKDQTVTIRWVTSSVNYLRISFSVDNGETWTVISDSVNAYGNVYNWTIPDVGSDRINSVKILLSDVSGLVSDVSDAPFTILNFTDVDDNDNHSLTLLENVYPEPATETFTVKFNLQAPGMASLTILNAAGRIVKNIPDSFREEGQNTEIFSASELESGVYFITLNFKGNTYTRKITIIK